MSKEAWRWITLAINAATLAFYVTAIVEWSALLSWVGAALTAAGWLSYELYRRAVNRHWDRVLAERWPEVFKR